MAMRPEGLFGRAFGWIMERMNRNAYDQTMKALTPEPGQALLEIGFGTGEFLALAAQKMGRGFLAGLDPSAQMISSAKSKLKPFETNFQVDLRLGNNTDMDWPDGTFDKIAAIHSFQFWEAPQECLHNLNSLLKPDGKICIMLRNHGDNPPDWLPNALSRSSSEAEALMNLLKDTGFKSVEKGFSDKHSTLISAKKT